MVLIKRRTAMLAAGGTLAMAALPRKSAAQQARPFGEAAVSTATRSLPHLNFTTADGVIKSLADYADTPIILNLWATWCVPCVAEMPDLDKLAARLGTAYAVLPLSSDRAGAPVVEAFYKAHNIEHLPVLLDPMGAVSHQLEVRGIPTTLLIDRKGEERARLEGPVEWIDPASLTKLHAVLG